MSDKIPITVHGILMTADRPNGNGRVYPKALLEREIASFQERIRQRRALVTAGTTDSESPAIRLSEVAGLLTEMGMRNDDVHVSVEVLDTLMGKRVAQWLQAGEVALHPVGHGSVVDGVVQDDYSMVGFSMEMKTDE